MNFSINRTILLENERVLLRPLTRDDHEAMLPIALSDPELRQYSPLPIHSPKLLEKYIDISLRKREEGSRYPFVIFDKAAQQYAGSTAFGAISNHDLRLEIGWTWIGAPFQRTGLNRNCKFLLLRYAFEKLQFERVEFKTDARNVQSRLALEKIEAKEEGTLRSHTRMSDGFRRDTVYYSILRREWPKIKETVFSNFQE